MKKEIIINDVSYEIVNNYNDALDNVLLDEYVTDYYDTFDYIVGDWAYGKLRLKGFYDKNNKKCKKMNDFANVNDYIKNYCAYGCRWFALHRVNKRS